MLLRSVSCVKLLSRRCFHRSPKLSDREDFENPITRTLNILSSDIRKGFNSIFSEPREVIRGIPKQCDIVVIGGGAIGSSVAYWLKKKSNIDSFSLVVIEKDFSYSKCSTTLSVGGLRQQFSLPENIQMSLYGAEFIRTLKKHFGPEADVNFTPHGYLVLASEASADQLMDNAKLQKELGAINMILQKHQIKDKFPWMNVDDVAVGCLGLEKEGWFDPWSMLQLIKKGAMDKGAHYVNAEVVDFKFNEREDLYVDGISQRTFEQPKSVIIKTADGEQRSIDFSLCVVAAGADSGEVAKLLNIGTGTGVMSVPLPVERRKRYVYTFDCEKKPPGLNTPMTIDFTGAYFRRDGLGGKFIAGMSPEAHDEPDTTDLEVNYEYFSKELWPILAHRVPAFNAIKVKGAWSGFYEYNTFDENGIVGPHPYYTNVYLATGFSGHGIQQSPAVGRAIAELILDGYFQTIDLTRMGFDRLLLEKPLLEAHII